MVQESDGSHKFSGEGFTFKAADGVVIHGSRWIPAEKTVKSILIINHGMAEHIRRYNDFALFLNDKGIAVWGEDHRGHGRTAGEESNLGYFADSGGWMKVVEDIRTLFLLIREENPDIPVFMMGHSMGSFLTRHYLSLYGDDRLAGAIISGTGYTPGTLASVGSLIANFEIRTKGPRNRSKVLDNMSFGSFNKPFKTEGSSGFEWLSRDREQVQIYTRDPLCGFICTSGHFKDLFSGVKIINSLNAFQNTTDKLPLLMISGGRDPVGDNGRGVRKVYDLYRKTGERDITLHLLPEGRHECLNEINKTEVYNILSDWMEKKVIS